MDADAEVQEIMRQYGYLGPSVAAAIAAALRRAHEAGLERAAGWCEKTGAFGPAYAHAIRALKEAPKP